MTLIYKSTRKYAATVIKKLMAQCDIGIWDIETVLNDIRYENGKKGYHDVEEYYREDEQDS